MSQRRSRIRLVLLITFVVLAFALGALHLSYPLPYVYTVVTDQGPDFDDIDQFPARSIAASESPEELVVSLDPRVGEVSGSPARESGGEQDQQEADGCVLHGVVPASATAGGSFA